jgi:hypothetical protein
VSDQPTAPHERPAAPPVAPPVRPAPRPNRYAGPWTGMVGALLVVVGVVVLFVVWRALNRDNDAVPPPTVDYQNWLSSVHADGRLAGLAPASLPAGWRPTSAQFGAGASPHWHLGVLTRDGQYVGLEEGLDPLADQVHQYVDDAARRGPDVRIGGRTWQTWTDAGGDYAVVRQQPAPKGTVPETVLVVGSAPPDQVRAFAASLR